MKTVTVRRDIRFPSFGLWKWKDADHNKPLILKTKHARALIYAHKDRYSDRDINVFPNGRIELEFSPPPTKLLRGLDAKGQSAQDAAQIIYEAYVDAFRQFQALLMSAGGVRMMLSVGQEGIHEFFEDTSMFGKGAQWKLDDGEYKRFNVKIPKGRGRHPLYTAQQLVTPSKWAKFQRAADDSDIPADELFELYQIRSKAEWREVRIAAIEASIISETLLRQYALQILKVEGFSNSKIKRLKDGLTFNNLLNVVLPLSLSKTELRKISSSIQAVDRLRTTRNGLVHGTESVTDIDVDDIRLGMDAAIRLVGFLKTKLAAS